ncbi:hypothetical protein LIA77_04031 [Sarocladium implicatum]|nr:hypothetical protein LIA77_04031 [Sarocladium implicatum]
MLTVTQPALYGHKSVHDLPTPPSTSRPSPPPAYQEQPHRGLPHTYHIPDQSVQLMSAPHRGLPPPAAMGLQPQQPPSNAASQPVHQSHPPPQQPSLSMPPHAHSHGQTSGHLPPPPQQWQGGEEHMKTWLVAKAEEEKTKQEEEKTRQEQLRLEQRKIEGDILRSSLSGGIPPPLIPLVFAGMGSSGGTASKTAMEWAQQYLSSTQGHHPQLLPAAGPVSPEHQRDYATPGASQYPAGTPGPSSGLTAQGSFTSHTGSPTRPRGQTMSGPLGRVSSGLSSFPAGAAHQGSGPMSHQQGPGHTQQGQQDPPLYFHHWQPPSTQGGSSSNPPGTPSGSSKTKRKRDSL